MDWHVNSIANTGGKADHFAASDPWPATDNASFLGKTSGKWAVPEEIPCSADASEIW